MAWKDVTVEALQKYGAEVGVPPGDSDDPIPPHGERLALVQARLEQLKQDFPNLYDHFETGFQGAYEMCLHHLGPQEMAFAAHTMLCTATWLWITFAALRECNETNGAKRGRRPKVVADAERVLREA